MKDSEDGNCYSFPADLVELIRTASTSIANLKTPITYYPRIRLQQSPSNRPTTAEVVGEITVVAGDQDFISFLWAAVLSKLPAISVLNQNLLGRFLESLVHMLGNSKIGLSLLCPLIYIRTYFIL